MIEDNEVKLDDEENEEMLLNDAILKKEEEAKNIIAKYNREENMSKDTIMVSKFDEKSGHIIYFIKGTAIECEITRRYKEFYAYYEKLKKRWPGIYIPPISKKQICNNLDIETLKKRKNQLDVFVKEIYKTHYLFESEESKIFFSKDYGEDTNLDIIKALNVLPDYTKQQICENYVTKLQPFYNDLKKIDFTEEQYHFCLQYIDNYIKVLNDYKQLCIEMGNEKETMIKNSSETLQLYENFEKLAVSEFIQNDSSKLIFYNASNFKLSQALIEFKKGIKNPYNIIASWVRQKEIELISMKESLNKYMKMTSEKENLVIELSSIENKLNDLNQGKKGFFATITMQDPEKLKEKYNKEKENKELDIKSMTKIIEILKDYYSFYIYDFFKLLKLSLYDLIKNFAGSQLSNSVKNSEFWLKVKIDETEESNKDV